MLMKISEYRMTFSPGSRPDRKTVVSWIVAGTLYAERKTPNGPWYVDPDKPVSSNPLVMRILSNANG